MAYGFLPTSSVSCKTTLYTQLCAAGFSMRRTRAKISGSVRRERRNAYSSSLLDCRSVVWLLLVQSVARPLGDQTIESPTASLTGSIQHVRLGISSSSPGTSGSADSAGCSRRRAVLGLRCEPATGFLEGDLGPGVLMVVPPSLPPPPPPAFSLRDGPPPAACLVTALASLRARFSERLRLLNMDGILSSSSSLPSSPPTLSALPSFSESSSKSKAVSAAVAAGGVHANDAAPPTAGLAGVAAPRTKTGRGSWPPQPQAGRRIVRGRQRASGPASAR
mmetsp:Transcript_14713/g.37145  ORF Transcript_14713/g.37145 Transcript_14713/m.37145 type:complete len:277 (-) Transcript_14713:80-910(-)